MKKTYISPDVLIVCLAPTKVLLSGSDPDAYVDKTSGGIAPEGFETKGISDVNLWDNEW